MMAKGREGNTVKAMAPKRNLPINKRLVALRERLKISQSEMARKFRVSLRTYQRFESTKSLDGPAAIVLEMFERETGK